ncbi:hypothetical protein ILUMI_20086 [Ignelater luminosus]|uniref:Uncharacterized protein n=1 Tax=Ignelater luminosus TaxID=2038154 RepID=A0A8K0CEY0_IGNLU|nr:hypothetical protein ILUMI_20086 [Ignelater luminosus]
MVIFLYDRLPKHKTMHFSDKWVLGKVASGCLWCVLEVTKTELPSEAAQKVIFKQNDVKARNIIMQCLADNMLKVVTLKKTAKEMIEALSGTYTKKGMQVQLQRKLRGLKCMEDTPLHAFLTNFERVVCELKAAGEKIENNEVIS